MMQILQIVVILLLMGLCIYLREIIKELAHKIRDFRKENKEALLKQEKGFKELLADVHDRITIEKNNNKGNIILSSDIVNCWGKPYIVTIYEVARKHYDKLEHYGCFDSNGHPDYIERFFITVNGHCHNIVFDDLYIDYLEWDNWSGFCDNLSVINCVKDTVIDQLKAYDKETDKDSFYWYVNYFDGHWRIKL